MNDNSFLFVPGKFISAKVVCKPELTKRPAFFKVDVNRGAFFDKYLFEINGKKIPTILSMVLFSGEPGLTFNNKIYTKVDDDNCSVEFSGIVLKEPEVFQNSFERVEFPFMFSGFDKIGSLSVKGYKNL